MQLLQALPSAQEPVVAHPAYLDADFVSFVRVLNLKGGIGGSAASVVRGLDVRGNAFEHIHWETIQPRSCADCSFADNSFREVLKPMKESGHVLTSGK